MTTMTHSRISYAWRTRVRVARRVSNDRREVVMVVISGQYCRE